MARRLMVMPLTFYSTAVTVYTTRFNITLRFFPLMYLVFGVVLTINIGYFLHATVRLV